jgi:L-asparagine permease
VVTAAFVSYAREFLGEKGAYVTGWMYFLNWATTGIADITAVALYVHYWGIFLPIPQWTLALIALAIVLGVNLISVKIFGEMEFWFSVVKVSALVAFMLLAIVLVLTRHPIAGHSTGFDLISSNGGLLPNGLLPAVVITQSIIFAYAAIELVGVTAGETGEPAKVVPKAVNSISWRIVVFYVGSVLLLAMLLPWNAYQADQSPFVTVMSKLGVPGMGSVMNLVVLTAAMSSLNSGLYSTGRILRSMAMAGSAPKFTARMSRRNVPYGGILLTTAVCVLGVILNYIVPANAFNIVLNVAAICILTTWGMIMIEHLVFWRRARAGLLTRPKFRLPGSPVTEIVTLAFLLTVMILMGGDSVGRLTLMVIPVLVIGLVVGWFGVRKRVAATRAGQQTEPTTLS